MPRQPRLDAPGLIQHVMARGIERRKIFRDDDDRESFLQRFALILEETQTQCYAWALMPNHFHLLLRIGPTPLSKVMRRLMTGYAVTFNGRHRRRGHLFQNRYKSVICEEDPYLLELIRYIHLNPLRAKLVKDFKELDKYPWTGHSAILGRRKNVLVSEVRNLKSKDQRTPNQPGHPNKDKASVSSTEGGFSFSLSSGKGKKREDPSDPVNPVKNEKPLAEKTIEDVLLHFGETKKVARQRYRQFVKKGIDQGKRPELQGGGLVRSAGGDKRGLLGRKKEEREKGDARILGSGDFVEGVLESSKESYDIRKRNRINLEDLIQRVIADASLEMTELKSSKRNGRISKVRAVISFLAVNQLGMSATEVGRKLGITGMGVGKCADRAKKNLDTQKIIEQYLR